MPLWVIGSETFREQALQLFGTTGVKLSFFSFHFLDNLYTPSNLKALLAKFRGIPCELVMRDENALEAQLAHRSHCCDGLVARSTSAAIQEQAACSGFSRVGSCVFSLRAFGEASSL